jgi:hypothetical protein
MESFDARSFTASLCLSFLVDEFSLCEMAYWMSSTGTLKAEIELVPRPFVSAGHPPSHMQYPEQRGRVELVLFTRFEYKTRYLDDLDPKIEKIRVFRGHG